MANLFNRFFGFLREVYSEGGQGSYSRFVGGSIVFAVLGWVTYLVFKNHTMPDLGGPSMFIAAGGATHYMTNKASDIIDSIKGNNGGSDSTLPQSPTPTTPK